ncbi:uncharacterized protein HD556DRAFT_1314824 [Suillus plorans]|uniref:Nephrocystin 3-like N-terminal domain-containing protein n=1 Tax=Suillus plorans TaxID=116603 RepID=A0A9P7AAS3_9AGAM|nr:uncharacterized protein HD556DRAFT_1314824 [Suillus plorans]KAG1784752.1 hypothetical protein HD556DRAFT_1314824 [Suillus plorans]
MDQADLSQLRTEFIKLANDLASSRLRGIDLEDLKLPEDSELELRLKKRDKFMAKVKAFLGSCDGFLQPLAGMSPIAAPLYGGLKCIVTVIYGLNDVLDGLPLIIRSERTTNLSEQRHAIISAFKAFIAFMQILRDYIGAKTWVVKRIAKSPNIPGKLRTAREEMRAALHSAHFGTFVAYVENEQRWYISHVIDTIQKKEEDAGHRGVLLYYFCGADPAADQYSDVRQEASSKAILMTLLRQIVSACHHSIAGFGEVLEYVDYERNELSEKGLRTRIANLLESFDTVRIIIDAVDCCENRAFQQDGLIPWILNNMPAHAYILLTACRNPYVTSLLDGLPTIAMGSDSTTQSDLEAYARHVTQLYIGEAILS